MRCLRHVLFAVGLLAATAAVAPVRAAGIEHTAFVRTWERTDLPVVTQRVQRTWMWGPEAHSIMLLEPYAEAPGGQRVVQYFDKSRMEITNPAGEPSSIWYVTNGLLVQELVTGRLQVGESSWEQHPPAQVNVAGDPGDDAAPTYASFIGLLHTAPLPVGATVQRELRRDGTTLDNPAFGAYNVFAVQHVPETNHTIAAPFWEFMNATGLVYENGSYVTAALFPNPYYATGYPISEAYWATVEVGGTPRNVLMQCFERRCLTYAPENPPAWQVEAGNVGQHYYAWRYGQLGKTPVDAPTPTTGAIRITSILYNPPGTEGEQETLTLTSFAPAAVQMQGWRIEDAGGSVFFRFPSFELAPGASVTIHACNGFNTPTLLYNGRCSATWNNDGDTAFLYNAFGQLVSTYGY
ncbi:MAG: hypothetical protein DCC58_15245 [Chloroflexi bacterium]|nr:MAG: hypothetical protein DCC58_15245 [Chloroflexota bacterium]